MNLLDNINSPEDLRKLDVEQLPQLCAEIRQFLIEKLSNNPGHFGSSMGAVDFIVALHYVFDTPQDRLVWDVGHQAYAHKLLTGRRDLFSHQRTQGGISGFPFPAESKYDTFVCGHAGNSISAALGMAIADLNTPGNQNRKTVAIVGDASISSGLPFEGLNNASNNPNNLLIILNDNDMSIDYPVGALNHYFTDLTTSSRYNRMRFKLYHKCKRLGIINDKRKGLLQRFNNAVKALISSQQNIFEGLNIRYMGPFDGNDVVKLVNVFREVKDMTGPRILHLRTVKGKGYQPAEANPQEWHAPGNFDPQTGTKISSSSSNPLPLWQHVFGETLTEMASKNPDIVGITAAMLSGTSMGMMMKKFPKRTFDVGISEGHAVTFAGGLAAAGKKPFVAIYSSFLQRSFDNIIHDVAIQGLPVVFCIDRAGVVGEDGITHHGVFDLAYLRMIPGMTIASPRNDMMLRSLMHTAETFPSPLAIRYPRGTVVPAPAGAAPERLTPGVGEIVYSSESASSPAAGQNQETLAKGDKKVSILTIGPIATEALKAAETLKNQGIAVDAYDMIWLKPLDTNILKRVAENSIGVVTVEDGTVEGGLGSAVTDWMNSNGYQIPVRKLGVPDSWQMHASVAQLQHNAGYDAEGIEIAVKNLISKA